MINRDCLVVIPTFNEAENIESLILSILKSLPTAHVLIIDDGSPDGTFEICQRISELNSNLFVFSRGLKLGLASAFVYGLKRGLAEGYRSVVLMDGDGSHQVVDLVKLLRISTCDVNAQLVLGSRWVKDGSVINWPWHRILLSRSGNTYARWALGIEVHDITAGFRVFRRELLEKLDLAKIESEGFCFHIETTKIVSELQQSIVEVPITFVEREFGKSKMNFAIAFESLRNVTIWGLKKRMPFFG